MPQVTSQFIDDYHYLDTDESLEHSPDVVLQLLKGGNISQEEARRMLGLFDESEILCHKHQ